MMDVSKKPLQGKVENIFNNKNERRIYQYLPAAEAAHCN